MSPVVCFGIIFFFLHFYLLIYLCFFFFPLSLFRRVFLVFSFLVLPAKCESLYPQPFYIYLVIYYYCFCCCFYIFKNLSCSFFFLLIYRLVQKFVPPPLKCVIIYFALFVWWFFFFFLDKFIYVRTFSGLLVFILCDFFSPSSLFFTVSLCLVLFSLAVIPVVKRCPETLRYSRMCVKTSARTH